MNGMSQLDPQASRFRDLDFAVGKLKEVAKDLPNAAPDLLKVSAAGCLGHTGCRWRATGKGALGRGQALGTRGPEAQVVFQPKLLGEGVVEGNVQARSSG